MLAEAFMVLDTNTQCGQDTLLATLEECHSAKTVLDPGAGADVQTETYANAPKGCSRYKGVVPSNPNPNPNPNPTGTRGIGSSTTTAQVRVCACVYAC